MIRAGSAVSDSSTAPRTDCSASRFCGGATGPSTPPRARPSTGELWPLVRSGALMGRSSLGRRPVAQAGPAGPFLLRPENCREVVAKAGRSPSDALLLLDDHRLDGRDDAVGDLDLDHARANRLDRLAQTDVVAVDRQAAGLLDRVGDVLGRDGAEQAPVLAGLVRDREHGLVEQLRTLLRLRLGVGDRALSGLPAALRRVDRALGRGLGQLARDQEVAEVALRDVDDRAALTELLHVLEQNRLGHDRCLPLAVAVAVTIAVTARAALVARLAGVADVGQQRELTRPLDRRGDLVLVPPARSGDAARADLAAIRDELPERVDVLVVDELDLVAAVLAGLAASAAGTSLAITPARRPAALLCHVRKPLLKA